MLPMTAALHTPTAPTTLTITRPDDWHLHVRDGEPLHTVVPHTAAQFGRAIIMPNLRPPVTTAEQAMAYKQRILAAVPAGMSFEPLMTLYLTDNLPPEEIVRAKAAGVVACKLYPAGATTNSDAGVTDLRKTYKTLEAMQKAGMLLLVHGEVTSSDIDLFDREAVFIEQQGTPPPAAAASSPWAPTAHRTPRPSRNTPAAAQAATPPTPPLRCMPRRSTTPVRSTSSKVSPASTAPISTACRATPAASPCAASRGHRPTALRLAKPNSSPRVPVKSCRGGWCKRSLRRH